ncbi:OLC1v1022998C1 [Oldenlandia corymbosa var. corymbosa]|uniref:OLC1v1022998C1 n=1 Tax=Oldenlandia corymbosa var. corymbosa TaxID=529605 RepID=A0AAV1C1Q8_OLDCO|nr:OLC1v1022998C1 [Oldenlandia corymbosa var. corymbosa]
MSSAAAMEMEMEMMEIDDPYVFDDYFPSMIERLGYEGLMKELCTGFCLLMDVSKGLITFESLKRSTLVLGLHDIGDDEIICMLAEGDMDGDGALNQMEFCILMFRLSPGLGDHHHQQLQQHGCSSSKLFMEDMGIMNDM